MRERIQLFVAAACAALALAAPLAAARTDPPRQLASAARPGASLAVRARRVALHGGILGTCHGCATARTRELVRQVFAARFASAGGRAVRTATCLVGAESGFNPGAISSTGDYGPFQANRAAHERPHPEWYAAGRGFKYLIFDPAYAAGQMWAMSHAGRSWTPWTGTYGRGLCRY